MKYHSITTFVFSLILVSIAFSQTPSEQREGTLTDPRDGRTYKTIRIGEQVWMAENLNYGVFVPDCRQTNNGVVEKSFYKNDTLLGRLYGGLYTWQEAMNWDKDKRQGICPEGWHIPSREEWIRLSLFLGSDSAGQMLKVTPSSPLPWDGNNRSGFSAIPSGIGYGQYFGRLGQWAVFWSSSQADMEYAWFAQLDGFWYPQPPKYKILYIGNYYLKDNAFCIRCIKD